MEIKYVIDEKLSDTSTGLATVNRLICIFISDSSEEVCSLQLPSRRTSVESRDDDSEMDVDSDLDSVPVVLGRNAKRVAAKQC